MNKGIATVGIVFWTVFGVLGGAALTVFRGPHIDKKAAEYCKVNGCSIEGLSQAEKIELIRDK